MSIESDVAMMLYGDFTGEEQALINGVVRELIPPPVERESKKQHFKVRVDAQRISRSRFGITDLMVEMVSTKLNSATVNNSTQLNYTDLWVIRAGILKRQIGILMSGEDSPELKAQRELTQQLYRKCFIRSV